MTPPSFPALSALPQTLRDAFTDRPLFRPPSLDELLGLIDFRAFAEELSRPCESIVRDSDRERTDLA